MAKIVEPDYEGGTLQIRYGYKHAGRLKAWFVVRSCIPVSLDPEIVKDYRTQWVIWDGYPTDEDKRGLGWYDEG